MADTGHQVGESWSAALTAVNTLSLRSVYSAEQVSVGQNGGMAAAGGMSVRAGIRAGDGVQVVSGRVTVMQGAGIFGKLTTDGTRLFHFIRNFFVQYFQAPSSSLICWCCDVSTELTIEEGSLAGMGMSRSSSSLFASVMQYPDGD
jgi:hypothetical protein